MNTRLDFKEIKTKANGRWRGIYASLGIGIPLDKPHGPCPYCKGTDRFRFTDERGDGEWYCNQCVPHAGDGINLIQKVLNCDIKEAFEAVAKVVDVAPLNPITQEKKATPEEFQNLLKKSYKLKKNDPVHKYLKGRGLLELPETLYYTPHAYEFETRREQEAMLAIFRAPDGEALTIHRTFIKDGKKLDIKAPKKLMTPLKKMTGGAVRLYNGKPEVMGVCEGIETAIAVHQMYGVVIWPCLNANLMEAFVPPEWVNTIRIYSDNDSNYAGQKSAYTLASRLSLDPFNLRVDVFVSRTNDFLDDLNMGIK